MWNDISTAPRDGTRILVAFKTHGVLSVAWEEASSGITIWCVDDFKFGPYAVRGYIETDVLGWMPLPDPPSSVPFTAEQKSAIAKAVFDNDYAEMNALKAAGKWIK